MRLRRALTGRLALALAAAALAIPFIAACGDDDEAGSTAAPPATAAASTSTAPVAATLALEATASGDMKAITTPESVAAGLVTLTLTNSDTVPRSAQLVRIDGEQTLEEVLAIFTSDEDGAPTPAFIEDGGGVATVAPGQTAAVMQVLAPGRYAVVDAEGGMDMGPSNAELGAAAEFTVTGEAVEAELPEVPGRITALDTEGEDYGFEFEGLQAGENQVRFENTGSELHHALLFPIAEGKTLADVEAFIMEDGPPSGPAPLDFEKGVGTAVIDGGIAQNVTLQLDVGRYAAVCFIPDRAGGPPHAVQGMLAELTVE